MGMGYSSLPTGGSGASESSLFTVPGRPATHPTNNEFEESRQIQKAIEAFRSGQGSSPVKFGSDNETYITVVIVGDQKLAPNGFLASNA
jgi:hypothetical protein